MIPYSEVEKACLCCFEQHQPVFLLAVATLCDGALRCGSCTMAHALEQKPPAGRTC